MLAVKGTVFRGRNTVNFLRKRWTMANPNPCRTGLKPWKKGQSGNPSGSSRRSSDTALLIRRSRCKAVEDVVRKLGGRQGDAIVTAAVLYLMAMGGNFACLARLLEITDGPVRGPRVHFPRAGRRRPAAPRGPRRRG